MSVGTSEDWVIVAPHGKLGSRYLVQQRAAERLRSLVRLKSRFSVAWSLAFVAYWIVPLMLEISVVGQFLWLSALVVTLFGGAVIIERRIRRELNDASEIETGWIHYRKGGDPGGGPT